MDEDDYRDLIALVEGELRDVGAADIAEPSRYMLRDFESDEARLLEPKKRLIEMLMAFDRRLAIQDRATYDRAIGRINEHLREERLKGAVVIPTNETGEGAPILLADAPMLRELRDQLQRLIGQLREDAGPPTRGSE